MKVYSNNNPEKGSTNQESHKGPITTKHRWIM